MYIIVAYDVGVERVNQVRIFLRQYLNWVQNSVFEGDATESELMRIERGLKERIDESVDFIVIYQLSSNQYLKTKKLGTPKSDISTIL